MRSLFESFVLVVVLLNVVLSVGMIRAFVRTMRGDVDSMDDEE